MPLRVLIADDEQLARNELCFQLNRLTDVLVVGQAADGIQAAALTQSLLPDLVLLDVQMPGMTGFEVAQQCLERNVQTRIVFVTAYDQYVIDAFKVNAVDYLLKPVEATRLAESIQRVRQLVSQKESSTERQELERIVKYTAKQQSRRDSLALKAGERFLLVQAEDVIYVSLSDDVITIVTESLSGTSNYRTLDELHAHLDPTVFWRVHRSHIVNINKIKEIMPWFSRNYLLRMKDGKDTEIPVSRSQTKRLREYLSL